MKLKDIIESENFNHWVVFTSVEGDYMHFHHAVAYGQIPSEEEIKRVTEEVRSDPEFGIGDLVDELQVLVLEPGEPETEEFLDFLKSEQ